MQAGRSVGTTTPLTTGSTTLDGRSLDTGAGLNPLRGQNNVQGCSDSGGLPNVFTAYQSVSDDVTKAKFETYWGTPLNPLPGLNRHYSDLCLEAEADGWTYEELVNGILDEAERQLTYALKLTKNDYHTTARINQRLRDLALRLLTNACVEE